MDAMTILNLGRVGRVFVTHSAYIYPRTSTFHGVLREHFIQVKVDLHIPHFLKQT